MKHGDERPRAHQLVTRHKTGNVCQGYPGHVTGLFHIRRVSDVFGAVPHKDLVRRINHADHGLIRDHMLKSSWTPACLFFRLTHGRCESVFARVHNAAGELPAPLVRHEPVPPEHQDSVAIVYHRRNGNVLQPDDVVLEALHSRRLDVDESELDPAVVIDRPLPMDSP
ncbi:hypothetical protein SABIM44S_00575 [Streptomyces abikoensis]